MIQTVALLWEWMTSRGSTTHKDMSESKKFSFSFISASSRYAVNSEVGSQLCTESSATR